MAKVSFDGVNKLITILSGVTDIDVRVDMYLPWKEWVTLNPMYLAAFRTTGGDPTYQNQTVPSYYFLINGWKVKAENVSVTLYENLYTDDDTNPFIIINSSILSKNSDIPSIEGVNNTLTGITETLVDMSDSIKHILGLSQQNYRLSDQIYDSQGRLLSSTIKLYNTASDCNAETNHFASYDMSAAYDVNGLLYDYKVIKH